MSASSKAGEPPAPRRFFKPELEAALTLDEFFAAYPAY